MRASAAAFFFFNDTATTEIYTLSLHDALPILDYALPKADDVPSPEIWHLETPSPVTPGGVKGMGEGGTIGAPAAIANAVADAVRGLGVRVTRLPIRAESLVRAGVA